VTSKKSEAIGSDSTGIISQIKKKRGRKGMGKKAKGKGDSKKGAKRYRCGPLHLAEGKPRARVSGGSGVFQANAGRRPLARGS